MFVLGVDPGLSRCGYGVVERGAGGELRAVAGGVVRTSNDDPLPQRLHLLAGELRSLAAEHRPAVVVVERVLFQVNARTAMATGQAAGIALLTAAEGGCDVTEYSANEVKQALVGYGSATKSQVQRMVATVLGLPSPPDPPDVADALALAVCYLTGAGLRQAVDASATRRHGPQPAASVTGGRS
jgi:crossover junction endodeoxyribonuclease RuvC